MSTRKSPFYTAFLVIRAFFLFWIIFLTPPTLAALCIPFLGYIAATGLGLIGVYFSIVFFIHLNRRQPRLFLFD